MPRTTIDIDAPVLRDLKRLQDQSGKSLGQLVSELVAQALGQLRQKPTARTEFRWPVRAMRARVDLEDKEALWRELDRKVKR